MKTALVTGGNKGIGFAVCKGLAEKGFRVFLGSRDAKRGQQAVEALRKAGHKNVELLELDVSNADSIKEAVRKLSAQTDHLDALVNNAGVYLDQNADALTVGSDVILDTLKTNTLGPLLMARAVLPLMQKAGHGQIVNVSSGMGQLSDMNGGSAAYRISKTSLNAVTRILATELSRFHIQVNSVCPGWVKTDMGGKGATRSVEQGADTIVWLAAGEGGHASGGFFRDRKPLAW
jgi:NAD(P)-dependent dehydrogenase (short-subunit alcohol dehydrogenase family)